MFTHNTDVAMRNLSKYKLQTLISVLSIAIGIVVLATVHSYVRTYLKPPIITTTPYYDRVCTLVLDSMVSEYQQLKFNHESLGALTEGDKFSCAERELIIALGGSGGEEFYFMQGDSSERMAYERMMPIDASYPNFCGYRSALTGKPIAVLNSGEAILSETMAQKLFGKENPVGKVLTRKFEYNNNEYHKIFYMKVVDVYQDLGKNDIHNNPCIMYVLDKKDLMWALANPDKVSYHYVYLSSLYALLKEGHTPEQLMEEANACLEPLGLKVKVWSVKQSAEKRMLERLTARTLLYLMGSLILLAACIGFLRMQLQLFWMRKREMTLRIINGAKRWDLFVLLMIEVGIVVFAAVAVALLLSQWLEPLINLFYRNLENSLEINVAEHLLFYSVGIGVVLLFLFGMVVWLTLSHICNSAFDLTVGLRGGNTHTFRRFMLWLQITVGMMFVSAALLTALICDRMTEQYALPEDETPYRESIYVNSSNAENFWGLIGRTTYLWEGQSELCKLPDLEQVIVFNETPFNFPELAEEDSLLKTFSFPTNSSPFFWGYETNTAAILDFYDMKPTWLRPELKDSNCFFVHEELYHALQSKGLLESGCLTTTNRGTLPVAGTFKEMAFHKKAKKERKDIIAIDSTLFSSKYILVPKAGRSDSLWNDVRQTIARVSPVNDVDQIAFNCYEYYIPTFETMKTVRRCGWILGGVALLICLMSIYSTISLDTRSRRKEVAIRKINGALARDIAMLFTRMYIVLAAIALAVTLPVVSVLQHYYTEKYYYLRAVAFDTPTVLLVILSGCFIVCLCIALIVGWHVRRIMRVNPAEMIAKE